MGEVSMVGKGVSQNVSCWMPHCLLHVVASIGLSQYSKLICLMNHFTYFSCMLIPSYVHNVYGFVFLHIFCFCFYLVTARLNLNEVVLENMSPSSSFFFEQYKTNMSPLSRVAHVARLLVILYFSCFILFEFDFLHIHTRPETANSIFASFFVFLYVSSELHFGSFEVLWRKVLFCPYLLFSCYVLWLIQ